MTTPHTQTDRCSCKLCKHVPLDEQRLPQPGLCHMLLTDGEDSAIGTDRCGRPTALGGNGRPALFCDTRPEGHAAQHNSNNNMYRQKVKNAAREQERAEAEDDLQVETWTGIALSLHAKLEQLPNLFSDHTESHIDRMRDMVDHIAAATAQLDDLRLYEVELTIHKQRAQAEINQRIAAEVVCEDSQRQADEALSRSHAERQARLDADLARQAAEVAHAEAMTVAEDYREARDAAQAEAATARSLAEAAMAQADAADAARQAAEANRDAFAEAADHAAAEAKAAAMREAAATAAQEQSDEAARAAVRAAAEAERESRDAQQREQAAVVNAARADALAEQLRADLARERSETQQREEVTIASAARADALIDHLRIELERVRADNQAGADALREQRLEARRDAEQPRAEIARTIRDAEAQRERDALLAQDRETLLRSEHAQVLAALAGMGRGEVTQDAK